MVIFLLWQTTCHDPSNLRYQSFTAKFLKAISLYMPRKAPHFRKNSCILTPPADY